MPVETDGEGRKIITDSTAESSRPDQPAFLSRPSDAPVYHGFPIIEESETDGWRIGIITEFVGEDDGDAFVIAPDGSRAGLVWEVGPGEFSLVVERTPDRWGVYAVWFPVKMNNTNDLVANFRVVLPLLISAFESGR